MAAQTTTPPPTRPTRRRQPVRVWTMRPIPPDNVFCEARMWYEHDDPAVVDAYVKKLWPKGLPPTCTIGRMDEEQFTARWHSNL